MLMFITALYVKDQTWKQSSVYLNRSMEKTVVVYPPSGILLKHEKELFMCITNKTGLKNITKICVKF